MCCFAHVQIFFKKLVEKLLCLHALEQVLEIWRQYSSCCLYKHLLKCCQVKSSFVNYGLPMLKFI